MAEGITASRCSGQRSEHGDTIGLDIERSQKRRDIWENACRCLFGKIPSIGVVEGCEMVLPGRAVDIALGRHAGRDAAASPPRPLQRPREHPQRQQCNERHGQHRRRSCDLPPAIRCTVDLRYRGAAAAQFELGQDFARLEGIAGDGALAIAAAQQPPGRIATLILPAD
jgi:hypothetical protein